MRSATSSRTATTARQACATCARTKHPWRTPRLGEGVEVAYVTTSAENRMPNEDVGVILDGHVATVELRRPPNNFIDVDLIAEIATALERLADEPQCRSIVLAAAGKHFCAGGNLKERLEKEARGEKFVPAARHPYREARRLVQTRKP